jgi:phage baseplate assembly protein gpV
VESIEPTQYTSEAPGAISNLMYFGSDGTVTANPVDNSTPIGFALGGGNQSETVSVSSYGTYITSADYGVGTGDVHISGNLIVDGSITWGGNSNFSAGPGNYETPAADSPESPKEEPPEDPIDNRFDILDL